MIRELPSKLQAIWLFFVLTFGQVHACASLWVLPDGTPCRACPVGPCAEQESNQGDKVTGTSIGPEKDCHACCVQQFCDDPETHQNTSATPQPHFDIAFIQANVELLPDARTEPRPVQLHIETGLPNAPPGRCSSRAPPVSLS